MGAAEGKRNREMPTKQKISRPNRSRLGPNGHGKERKKEKKTVLAEMPDGCWTVVPIRVVVYAHGVKKREWARRRLKR